MLKSKDFKIKFRTWVLALAGVFLASNLSAQDSQLPPEQKLVQPSSLSLLGLQLESLNQDIEAQKLDLADLLARPTEIRIRIDQISAVSGSPEGLRLYWEHEAVPSDFSIVGPNYLTSIAFFPSPLSSDPTGSLTDQSDIGFSLDPDKLARKLKAANLELQDTRLTLIPYGDEQAELAFDIIVEEKR